MIKTDTATGEITNTGLGDTVSGSRTAVSEMPTFESLLQPATPASKIIKRIKTLDDSNAQAFSSMVERSLEIGVLLTELKERCKAENKNWTDEYSRFGFRFDLRQAQNYMLMAKPENQDRVKALPPDTSIRGILNAVKPKAEGKPTGTPKSEPGNTQRVSFSDPQEDIIDAKVIEPLALPEGKTDESYTDNGIAEAASETAEEMVPKQLYQELQAENSRLYQRIAHLEAENEQLRQQLASSDTTAEQADKSSKDIPDALTTPELEERLGVTRGVISVIEGRFKNNPEKMDAWYQEKDPEGTIWQKTTRKRGKSFLYVPKI
jgi:hypothetical protein